MELRISKRQFLRGLARTHGVADRKSSMPILSNILIAADKKGTVRFCATDLYLGVTATTKAEVKTAGTVAVAARTLFDIVKNLPDGEVTFVVGDNNAAELSCGKIHYKIPGMPGEDFPPLPAPGKAQFSELDAEQLGELISLTQYSMSNDDTRPHLSGALFEGDGNVVRMVTTDGHRLSKAEQALKDAPKFTMLVPNKGVQELKRVIEDAKADRGKGDDKPVTVGVATSGGNAFFRRDDVLLSVKLADEQFPPYSKVIPQKKTRRVGVVRSGLVEAIKRISLVANDKSGGSAAAARTRQASDLQRESRGRRRQ